MCFRWKRSESKRRPVGDARGRRRSGGFSLIELLVVIAIIGILIALLLPAVQAARESGRRAQCANNLKQMTLACVQHEVAQGFFPTGGWGYEWTGDPDRGFTNRQPGGWFYNILPYIEQQDIHDMGKGGDPSNSGKSMARATLVATFMCPSRRTLKTYPGDSSSYNANPLQFEARSDYAANAGDSDDVAPGPLTLAAGDTANWAFISYDVTLGSGVSYCRSQVTAKMITDGLSKTYLLGEKYLDPDYYENGQSSGDNQSWDMGYDFDIYRWTNVGNQYTPLQDTAGVYLDDKNFGSAHPGAFQMAFCDGSVRAISYEIDRQTHWWLGVRFDGQVLITPDY